MERHDAVVIGAGQAGLSVAHELAARRIEPLILERDRVASSWAGLWDSFRVNTPNWGTRLPGLPYDGDDPDGYLPRDGIVGHLERYRRMLEAEVRVGVEVTRLAPVDGGFRLETSEGSLDARTVVVATGAYQQPFRPEAASLPSTTPTFDARTYREPGSIPDGVVVIVGGGQTGCQIAEDLLDADREVVIAYGKSVWVPRRVGDHDILWWAIETGFFEQTVEDLPTPMARLAANFTASGVDGGHDLHARTLQARGATVVGRFQKADGGRIRFADDLAESIAWGDARYGDLVEEVRALCVRRALAMPDLPEPTPFDASGPDAIDLASVGAVIFAGGFRPVFGSWIDVPGAFDDIGFPVQTDGASDVAPGLSFAGVHFLRTRKSSLLCGIAEDASVIAGGVARHLGMAT